MARPISSIGSGLERILVMEAPWHDPERHVFDRHVQPIFVARVVSEAAGVPHHEVLPIDVR
jgi:hypothetical protein